MSSCNRGRRSDLAQELHDKMQERGIECSGPCMNAYRMAIAKSGGWQKTLSMLDNKQASQGYNRDLVANRSGYSDHFQNVGENVTTKQATPDTGAADTIAQGSTVSDATQNSFAGSDASQNSATDNNVGIQASANAGASGTKDVNANTDAAKTDLCAFSITLQSLGSAGQVDKALELLGAADGQMATNAVMNGLLTGLSEYNKSQRASQGQENLEAGWKILDVFRSRGVKMCPRGATALLTSVVSPKLGDDKKREICAKVIEELSKDGGAPDALCYAKLSTLSSTVEEKRFWARQAAAGGLLPFWKKEGSGKIVDFHEVPPPFVKDVTRWALETCTPFVDLVLVCGRATHTPEQDKVFDEYGNKVSVLRESIIQALKDCNVTQVCPVRRNAGRLMVPREELIRWRKENNMAAKATQ